MDAIQYIEDTFLGGKHLTQPTKNQISSLCKSYGDKQILFILTSNENYLFSKKYNDQPHFESTILLLLKKKVPYVKKQYETFKGELIYNIVDRPPDIQEHEIERKPERSWIF